MKQKEIDKFVVQETNQWRRGKWVSISVSFNVGSCLNTVSQWILVKASNSPLGKIAMVIFQGLGNPLIVFSNKKTCIGLKDIDSRHVHGY